MSEAVRGLTLRGPRLSRHLDFFLCSLKTNKFLVVSSLHFSGFSFVLTQIPPARSEFYFCQINKVVHALEIENREFDFRTSSAGQMWSATRFSRARSWFASTSPSALPRVHVISEMYRSHSRLAESSALISENRLATNCQQYRGGRSSEGLRRWNQVRRSIGVNGSTRAITRDKLVSAFEDQYQAKRIFTGKLCTVFGCAETSIKAAAAPSQAVGLCVADDVDFCYISAKPKPKSTLYISTIRVSLTLSALA